MTFPEQMILSGKINGAKHTVFVLRHFKSTSAQSSACGRRRGSGHDATTQGQASPAQTLDVEVSAQELADHSKTMAIRTDRRNRIMTTIHDTIAQIEALHSAAGKWPTEPVQDSIVSGYYECPACNGEGSIDAEFVCRMHAGLVGVQVYGIGDQMAAMEKLLPLVIDEIPSLLAYIRALEKVRDLVSDEAFSPDVTTPFNRESQMFRDYWIDGTRVTDIREALAAAREAGK